MAVPTKATRRSSYFHHNGDKVLEDMKARYGDEKGEEIFYATANKWVHKGTKKQKAAQPKKGPGELNRRSG